MKFLGKRLPSFGRRPSRERKRLVKSEWWISYASAPPDLQWARLRTYSDGTADAAFDPSKVYGFDAERFARYFLSEDEYMRFDLMDEEDEEFMGVRKSELSVPSWGEIESADFEYIGEY